MKRRFIILFLFLTALSSCSANKMEEAGEELCKAQGEASISYEVPNDDVSSSLITTEAVAMERIEPVLYYDIYNNEPSNLEKEKDELLRRTVSASFSNEDELREFIHYYLDLQGINKQQPDTVAYVGGEIASEYYVDQESKQLCFVIYHISPRNLQNNEDFNNSISVTCISVPYESLEHTGYIGYEHDIEQGTTAEVLYDLNRNRETSVVYKYVSGVPFPIVMKYDVINSGYTNRDAFSYLMTNERFRLFEDYITYDNEGKLESYDACLSYNYVMDNHDIDYFKNEHSNSFGYDEDDKLIYVKEKPQTDNFDWMHWEGLYDYTGLMEISYQENGEPSVVEHSFFSYTHGTWDSSGHAIYDNQGRMVYRYHYVTSGGYSFAWFYEGDSREPWASIEWGGMYYSGIMDLDYYADFEDVPYWKIESAERNYDYSYGCDTSAKIFKDLDFK